MSPISMVLVACIAALHLYIAWFEMFSWETTGPKVFRSFPKDLFAPTKSLVFNQGAYNGLLAMGLIWSLLIQDPVWQRNVATCFLLFVALAGVAGAVSASRRILYVQTIPAVVILALVWAL